MPFNGSGIRFADAVEYAVTALENEFGDLYDALPVEERLRLAADVMEMADGEECSTEHAAALLSRRLGFAMKPGNLKSYSLTLAAGAYRRAQQNR
jgi:hypothetical protein